DACVIFDTAMLKRDVPVFNLSTRGLVYLNLRVSTGGRDLHSGIFGGAALNALNALTEVLASVLPKDGRVPEPLRAGLAPPPPEGGERAAAGGGARGGGRAHPGRGRAGGRGRPAGRPRRCRGVLPQNLRRACA